MDVVHEVASILNGVHNFKAFTLSASLVDKPPSFPTVRHVQVSVEPGSGFLSPYLPRPFAGQLEYWNLVFKSQSFLYRQVG